MERCQKTKIGHGKESKAYKKDTEDEIKKPQDSITGGRAEGKGDKTVKLKRKSAMYTSLCRITGKVETAQWPHRSVGEQEMPSLCLCVWAGAHRVLGLTSGTWGHTVGPCLAPLTSNPLSTHQGHHCIVFVLSPAA